MTNQTTENHAAPPQDTHSEADPDVERLDMDGKAPVEEEHPETPFGVVAVSYLAILFVTVISATAIIALWNAYA